MSLREHIAEHFWSYTIVGGLLGWAAVKGEQYAKDDQYAADAYDMNLHVWLCGRCHHVFDEKEEADECCLDEVDETAESVQAEMFIESDGLAVAVEGLDGTYLTDGEIKMGYTSASEAGFEPKELKTVMWVWDDIEGYGAYLATEQITFLSESFRSEHIPTDLPLSFSTPAVNTQTCIAGNPYFTFGLCDRSPDGWGNSRGSYGDVGMGQPTCSYCKKVWATMDEDEQRTYISQFEDWGGYYDAESFGGIVACKQENCPHGHCPRCGNCDDVLDNDGDGSEDDDNPMFCGACGESFSAESFASVVLAPEETTSPMRQALMTNYLIRKSMMEEELRYLQQEVLNGRMSRKQMAYRLMELEHRLRAEEDPKKRHKVKYLSGVKVKPRKLNGDLPPEVAMKRTLIGRESPETIKVEWDSNTQPIGSDPFNEVKWGAEQIEKGRRHRVGGQIVEECVDIQGGKVDETSNYYRVRFRDPKDFTNFRVPAWAARAANSIGAKYYDVRGSKITMGQTKEGGWKIQSVMVPNNSFVNPKEAAIIANHIQDRIEREGKWAKKECKDNERVLVVL